MSANIKKGLVLEGGAMRGMFTAGVLDVFMENNIEFDGIVGVSAGAAFGCNIKSKQIGRVIRYNTRYCNDKRYCSFKSLIKTGDIFGADFCYRELPFELDIFDTKTFSENPAEFYVTATDIETGKPVYKKLSTGLAQDLLWLRASASMPLVSRIVETEKLKLLDGGIADSIPIKFLETQGYNKNIVILTQPYDFIKKKNSMLPLIKLKYRKYKNLIKAVENRHIVYNQTTSYIKEKENKGEVLVIRPPMPLNIKQVEHNKNELLRVYEIGRKTATNLLPQIEKFLSK